MNGIKIIKDVLRPIRSAIEKVYYRLLLIPYYRNRQKKQVRLIQQKGFVNVCFFAINVSMWRYQGIYEFLRKDNRFRLYIVIHPLPLNTDEANKNNYDDLKAYFSERGMKYVHMSELRDNLKLKSFNPDILFYAQQYDGFLPQNIDASSFYDKLVCFIPYGLNTLKKPWNYNTRMQNLGWRMYYANDLLFKDAKQLTYCGGDNVVVVGDPHGDEFNQEPSADPWFRANGRKKIIWAPHFQIVSNEMFNRPSFLWTYDVMLELAKKYQDKIYIAFKPHPRLYSELCKHPEWGDIRAKEYYRQWTEMPNTQIEDGEYVELFKTSDALIHGCGSFTAEYQYTKKPCMYLTREAESIKEELCDFGLKCFNNHYIGANKKDIESFICNVVIGGIDPKYSERVKFYEEYLQTNILSSEAIYSNITSSLFR